MIGLNLCLVLIVVVPHRGGSCTDPGSIERRFDSMGLPLYDMMEMEENHPQARPVWNSYSFGLGKRSPMYSFGLGKKWDHDDVPSDKRSRYNFDLGKKFGVMQYSIVPVERSGDFSFGLGRKRSSYSFGLGRRNGSPGYDFGLGKRDDKRARQDFSFGLGKRPTDPETESRR
ncbi:unnamed protein product [Darwinula stevensoni]|uniref:Uncharacterized protein n=1 Tax=Darwinula stevensoni TaxID=69355 RepID=A0A7R9A558_9CRUS|nr:unnamed protein product [Darwinula stevensoni]CAG0894972.1 unnamed protein product [Darwinula stevensoni]